MKDDSPPLRLEDIVEAFWPVHVRGFLIGIQRDGSRRIVAYLVRDQAGTIHTVHPLYTVFLSHGQRG